MMVRSQSSVQSSFVWNVRLFGNLELQGHQTGTTRFRTQKTASLLAYLAFHRDHQPLREQLIEMLWPDTDIRLGRQNLSAALSSLRRQLEPPGIEPGSVLITDNLKVQLNPATVKTDVHEFETTLDKVSPNNNNISMAERKTLLLHALNLYRELLLPQFYDDWIIAQQRRLHDRYLNAVHLLLPLLEAERAWAQGLEITSRALLIEPLLSLNEEIQADYLRLLLQSGREGQAQRHLRELQQKWQGETGSALPVSLTALLTTNRVASAIPTISDLPNNLLSNHHLPNHHLPNHHLSNHHLSNHHLSNHHLSNHLPNHHLPNHHLSNHHLPNHHLPNHLEANTIPTHRGRMVVLLFLSIEGVLNSPLPQKLKQAQRIDPEDGNGYYWCFSQTADAIDALNSLSNHISNHISNDYHSNSISTNDREAEYKIALHIGESTPQQEDALRPLLSHAQVLSKAGHPGQILCSAEMAALLHRLQTRYAIQLRDLGRWQLAPSLEPEPLFQLEWRDSPQQFPPLNATRPTTAHLPLSMTRFFGREVEMERLCHLLQPNVEGAIYTPRLITLTGIGGVGKTRLALAIAQELLRTYRNRVWFVPLVNITSEATLYTTLTETLSIRINTGQPLIEQIIAWVGDQSALLILDNAEHLVDEVAALVGDLLSHLPKLLCLVTSRVRLSLSGETEMKVVPLPTSPGATTPQILVQSPSARLFVDRARMVMPDFQVTAGNVTLLAEICDRLEGIPLALEIAASRCTAISLSQMRNEITHRMDFLQSRLRNLPVRHRTLKATLDLSFFLLSEPARKLLTQLSIFRGGWTLEAAETICEVEQISELMEQLLEASLIDVSVPTPKRSDLPLQLRFTMLETVREYAATQLSNADNEPLQRRYLRYWTHFAQKSGERLQGSEQQIWFARYAEEWDNLRFVCEKLVEQEEIVVGMRLATDFDYLWYACDKLSEGIRYIQRLLASQASTVLEASIRVQALETLSRLLIHHQRREEAEPILLEALTFRRQMDQPEPLARCLSMLGVVERERCQMENARIYLEEALRLREQVGDQAKISITLLQLSHLAVRAGDFDRAQVLLERVYLIRKQFGNTFGTIEVLTYFSDIHINRGDYSKASAYALEGLYLDAQIGSTHLYSSLNCLLGLIAFQQEDFDEAERRFQEAFQFDTERQYGKSVALAGLGIVAGRRGNFEKAHSYLTELLTYYKSIQSRLALAAIHLNLADLALLQQNTKKATEHSQESLKQVYPYFQSGMPLADAFCRLGMALVERSPEFAVRFAATAHSLRATMKVPIPPCDRQRLAEAETAMRQRLSPVDFECLWNEGCRWSIEQAARCAFKM